MPKNSPDFQFLLQFVNIHCKKGVPACIRPDREIKRIPVKEPSVKPLSKNELEEVRSYLRKDGYIRSQIEKAIQEATGNHIISARDRKGAPHLCNGQY